MDDPSVVIPEKKLCSSQLKFWIKITNLYPKFHMNTIVLLQLHTNIICVTQKKKPT